MDLIQTVVTPLVLLFLGGLGFASIAKRLDRLELRMDAAPTREEWNALIGRFDRTEDHQGGVNLRLERLDVRIEGLPARFDGLDSRFDGLDSRFDGLERRFDRLEGRFGELASEYRAMRADLTQIALAVGARSRPQTG